MELNAAYWFVDFSQKELVRGSSWDDYDFDRLQLERGLIHLDRESAELHAKALIALTAKNDTK
ncbi:hypothetical protein ID853_13555 [Xenorhabdus sp. Vera]|uniref:hypothetical protein n=1 Tax=Xenorhabdus koppenhoeferi TaxID=351659 RepID=UPI00199AF90D|nr:hypothetical protein [Xenorhabdus sp. Vera]MBD2811886.1 hypothetical protein [Xenorhabdus sp. Vera]